MIETSNMMRSHKQAFTLVELLVAISFILVAASIIFVGGISGEGAKLSASQRIVSGIAQGARGQAILKKATTRLIIYSDDTGNSEDAKEPEILWYHLPRRVWAVGCGNTGHLHSGRDLFRPGWGCIYSCELMATRKHHEARIPSLDSTEPRNWRHLLLLSV